MITLDEITPEKMVELTKERDDNREVNHNRLAVERLRQELREAEREVEFLQAKRELRSKSLKKDGMSTAQIAEWWGVSVATVYNWLRSPLEIVLPKSASDLVREHYEVTDSHE